MRRAAGMAITLVALLGAACAGDDDGATSDDVRAATQPSSAVTTGANASTTAAPSRDSTPTTETAPGSTGTPTTPTAPANSTVPAEDRLVIPRVTDELPAPWQYVFTIPYGDDPTQLGTSPGGDSGTVQWGPDSGAPGPDGEWWFLDGAKQRVVQFGAGGNYVAEVVLDPSFLVDGVYFQYSLPRVLLDGTLVAVRGEPDHTTLLLVAAGVPQLVDVDRAVFPRADDGERLYGFDASGTGSDLYAVDPATGVSEPTDWFVGPGGHRYRLTVSAGVLRVELPDAPQPVDRTYELIAQAGGQFLGSIGAVMDFEGRLTLLFSGISTADESAAHAGITTVDPAGVVAPVTPMRDPSSESDPGSPTHLAVRPGTTQVYLVFVDTDGVRVAAIPTGSSGLPAP